MCVHCHVWSVSHGDVNGRSIREVVENLGPDKNGEHFIKYFYTTDFKGRCAWYSGFDFVSFDTVENVNPRMNCGHVDCHPEADPKSSDLHL